MARILVADDDDDMRLVLQIALEQQGHTVTLASNGTDALAVCLAGGIDFAMLDVTMPGLEGPEVVARVRADPEHQGLPILLVSANSLYEDINRGLDAGADDYITKPFQTFELHRRVERMVWLSQDIAEAQEERGKLRNKAKATLARLSPRRP
ncbi:response regulator transcription factor [Nocardioides sp.]|uniref:response regulator transcription factor n=1 Tax=Nocardioides sp. TaxID=35761 RepID=UPI00271B46A6|nr:response regulator [Nocardioides sp.]MDO9455437.1 response regulator [Nocardioides sp.]